MISTWKQQRASQRSPESFVCLCAFIYLKIPTEVLCCCLFYLQKNINEGSNMFLVALTAQKWRQKAIIMVFVRCWPHPSHDSVPLSIRRKKKKHRTAHGIFSFVCLSCGLISCYFYGPLPPLSSAFYSSLPLHLFPQLKILSSPFCVCSACNSWSNLHTKKHIKLLNCH